MSPFPVTSGAVNVGRGFSVEFSFDGWRIDCCWSPRMPTGKRARQVMPGYYAARDEFLTIVARRLGMNIGVVNLVGDA